MGSGWLVWLVLHTTVFACRLSAYGIYQSNTELWVKSLIICGSGGGVPHILGISIDGLMSCGGVLALLGVSIMLDGVSLRHCSILHSFAMIVSYL